MYLFKWLTNLKCRRLRDTYEASRRLSAAYETRRRLSDAYGHIYKKKNILVIFGKFKKRNPHAVVFFRWILDRNVVVYASRCFFLVPRYMLST